MIGRMFGTTMVLWLMWAFIGFAGEGLFTGGHGGAAYGAYGIFAAVVYFFPIVVGLPAIYAMHGGGFTTAADWKGHAVIAAMSVALMSLIVWFISRQDGARFLTAENILYVVVFSCPLVVSWVVYATVMNNAASSGHKDRGPKTG